MRSLAVVKAALVVLWGLSSSCAGPVSAPLLCVRVEGKFKANSTLREAEGHCPQAKEHTYDAFVFDKAGKFVSPLEGVVACTTVQEDCEVHVKCKAGVLKLAAQFDGTLSDDGQALAGLATFSGNYQGCTSVRYDVAATK